MLAPSCVMSLLMQFGVFSLASAFESEIISDLVTPMGDERRALDIKQQQFWQLVQDAAVSSDLQSHLAVYEKVGAAIAALPAENDHVKELLTSSLERLRNADAEVLRGAAENAALAAERLAAGRASGEGFFSFFSGGQDFLSSAVRRFVGGGYGQRVSQEVASRQAEVLPALRGAAAATGNVLGDCRRASQLGFDVLKYDIYNRDVPKTPAAAKDAANLLVEAAAQTRRQFTQGVTSLAGALAKDTEEKNVNPSAKVTQTLLTGLTPFGASAGELGAGRSSGPALDLAGFV
eukprot:TRINITY_DN72911_c0_g1_i1.p1 TRINITY_DN72911_c0_g1~~TRINITY_DN72911_c0_g1_i1.p1  ORF type:complete len:291 (+),score=95.40 TRINITY_DN72911_c0_g1_i1:76-948(+)